jgi:hypothetical protein
LRFIWRDRQPEVDASVDVVVRSRASASRSARSVCDHDRIDAVLRFRRRSLTNALDWLAFVLVVATLAISLTGG